MWYAYLKILADRNSTKALEFCCERKKKISINRNDSENKTFWSP
jgi:hypothetical protein